MSYNSDGVFTAGKCLNSLMQLSDVKGGMFSSAMKRSKLGYLEAANSPLNKSSQKTIPVQQGSKKRLVELRYRQRVVETQIATSKNESCTTDNYPDFNSTLFEVDKYASYSFKLNTTEFKEVCQGRTEFINESIQTAYDALAVNINRELLTEQALNFGINISTEDALAKNITVFPEATGAPNARALQNLMRDYEVDNEFMGRPIIVGAGNIYDYWKTLEAGCCNDAGINMLELSNSLGYAPFIDNEIKRVLADPNDFIVMEPNSVQFVTFNDYVGEDATSSGTSVSRGTIRDTKTGITYDIKVLQDDCDDDWTVIIGVHYGLFFQPVDAFHADDPLYQTNGTLYYNAITS